MNVVQSLQKTGISPLGGNFNLPHRWRLLEGMIAIAGLMTFAWSTGVLLTLAQAFQHQQWQVLSRRREMSVRRPAHGTGDADRHPQSRTSPVPN